MRNLTEKCSLTKEEVSMHEAIHRVLSMSMRHSNNDDVYISTVVKEKKKKNTNTKTTSCPWKDEFQW